MKLKKDREAQVLAERNQAQTRLIEKEKEIERHRIERDKAM